MCVCLKRFKYKNTSEKKSHQMRRWQQQDQTQQKKTTIQLWQQIKTDGKITIRDEKVPEWNKLKQMKLKEHKTEENQQTTAEILRKYSDDFVQYREMAIDMRRYIADIGYFSIARKYI